MSRIRTLSLFLCRELFRSLTGAIPPLLTLTFFGVTFYSFPFDADYLIAVGGLEMVLVCLVTTFLLAEKVNQAATYPFLLRLPRRSELLAAIAASSIAITIVLALLFVVAALLRHGIRLTPWELLHLTSRWLVLFPFAATVTLHLSQLVSRHYSHLLAYFLLGTFLTVIDQQRDLLRHNLDWLVQGTSILTYPVRTTLDGTTEMPITSYTLALLLTVTYSAALWALAAWLFRHKDLLWTE